MVEKRRRRRFRLDVALVLAALFAVALARSHGAVAVAAGGCQQPSVLGHWQGTLNRKAAALPVEIDFTCEGGTLRASFTAESQRAMEYPFESALQHGRDLDLVLAGNMHFAGQLSGATLSGTFKDAEGAGSFRLDRVARPRLPYTGRDVAFRNDDVNLAGSLYVPRGGGLHPAIVMLQGSGPETRWGANRFWADYLARRGIAVLIYDKRGSGRSGGFWQTADFHALAGDALAGVRFLTHQAGIDPSKIGIHGHSQGASIAPLVAAQSHSVAFVLADAANGIPMWQTEVYSQKSFVAETGLKGPDLDQALTFIDRAVQVERTGRGRDELIRDNKIAEQNRQIWATIVEPPPATDYFWNFFPKIADYDPAQYWRHVNVPVLIVEAGADERIPVAPSIAAIRAALNQAHNGDYTIVVFPGAPHTLVEQPLPGEAYHWPQITPGYADLLASWVLYRFQSAARRQAQRL